MSTALLIIDMQMMMHDRMTSGRDHVNSGAPANIASLANQSRNAGLPVIHVRHRDDTVGSPLHPESAGYQPMPCAVAREGEAIFIKTTSSAFASTELGTWCRSQGIQDITVVGAVASFCVTSAVRTGADLGFNMTVVSDAVIDFDLPNAGLGAQDIFNVTMGLLKADFAKVVTAQSLIEGSLI